MTLTPPPGKRDSWTDNQGRRASVWYAERPASIKTSPTESGPFVIVRPGEWSFNLNETTVKFRVWISVPENEEAQLASPAKDRPALLKPTDVRPLEQCFSLLSAIMRSLYGNPSLGKYAFIPNANKGVNFDDQQYPNAELMQELTFNIPNPVPQPALMGVDI